MFVLNILVGTRWNTTQLNGPWYRDTDDGMTLASWVGRGCQKRHSTMSTDPLQAERPCPRPMKGGFDMIWHKNVYNIYNFIKDFAVQTSTIVNKQTTRNQICVNYPINVAWATLESRHLRASSILLENLTCANVLFPSHNKTGTCLLQFYRWHDITTCKYCRLLLMIFILENFAMISIKLLFFIPLINILIT